MVTVPGFLLRRLYVKGSLKNSADGASFELKNSLGSGHAKELVPLEIDGDTVPMESSYFSLDGKETLFKDVSEKEPFTLAVNKSIRIVVKGKKLEPGQHKVQMGFIVVGLGKLSFDFTDKVD